MLKLWQKIIWKWSGKRIVVKGWLNNFWGWSDKIYWGGVCRGKMSMDGVMVNYLGWGGSNILGIRNPKKFGVGWQNLHNMGAIVHIHHFVSSCVISFIPKR